MLLAEDLQADLFLAIAQLERKPFAELLLQHGILRKLASDLLRQRLCQSVQFSSEEEPLVIARLFQGTAVIPPTSLAPGWLQEQPAMLQGPLQERWDQIRLQKWMEVTYRDQVEPYFLERRDELVGVPEPHRRFPTEIWHDPNACR